MSLSDIVIFIELVYSSGQLRANERGIKMNKENWLLFFMNIVLHQLDVLSTYLVFTVRSPKKSAVRVREFNPILRPLVESERWRELAVIKITFCAFHLALLFCIVKRKFNHDNAKKRRVIRKSLLTSNVVMALVIMNNLFRLKRIIDFQNGS